CGSATAPSPRLSALGEPSLGNPAFVLDLAHATANAPTLLGLGGSGAAPLGAGCTVFLAPIASTALAGTGPTGYPPWSFAVPARAALRGLPVSLQAGAIDATAPLGFSLSNAIDARIGD